jgi:hypothetical protein
MTRTFPAATVAILVIASSYLVLLWAGVAPLPPDLSGWGTGALLVAMWGLPILLGVDVFRTACQRVPRTT